MLRQEGLRPFLGQLLRPREWWARAKTPVILHDLNSDYAAWWAGRPPLDRAALAKEAAAWSYRPLVSIVMPVYNPSDHDFRAAIASVRAQTYEHWELCLADDRSSAPHTLEALTALEPDPKVRLVRRAEQGGISAASNSALEVARGEWVALMDHDDLLTPDALHAAVRAMNAEPEADFVYTDEDKIDPSGRHQEPAIKPDWSPDLLLSMNYITHFSLVRRELLAAIGGFRSDYDGSQDYDVILRATEHARKVVHVPGPRYAWRITPGSTAGSANAKRWAFVAGQRAIEDALRRRGVEATVEHSMAAPGRYRIHYAIAGEPLVSVVIPTRDRVDLLRKAVASVESAAWQRREIVIVDNGSVEAATLAYLDATPHRVVRDGGDFNFSRLVNAGVKAASGDHLLLLNNDTIAQDPNWIGEMLQHSQRPGVGAVGARLFYPNGHPQHEGVAIGAGGVFALHLDWRGYLALGGVARDVAAVTAACMMTPRAAWEQAGGFDESLAVVYNDIDYCLRLRDLGLRVVYTPHARLTHLEGASRGDLHPAGDAEIARARWGDVADLEDPYYNRLLDAFLRPYAGR